MATICCAPSSAAGTLPPPPQPTTLVFDASADPACEETPPSPSIPKPSPAAINGSSDPLTGPANAGRGTGAPLRSAGRRSAHEKENLDKKSRNKADCNRPFLQKSPARRRIPLPPNFPAPGASLREASQGERAPPTTLAALANPHEQAYDRLNHHVRFTSRRPRSSGRSLADSAPRRQRS